MSEATRVILIGKTVREAEGYWQQNRDGEYAGKTVKVMSVELVGNGQLRGLRKGTRIDLMPRATQHKRAVELDRELRALRPHGVEVRWCPSGSA